jgi:hypothetical protein
VLEFVKCSVIAIKVMVFSGGRSPSHLVFLFQNFVFMLHIGLFFKNSFVIYFFHIANGINIFHGA